MQRLLFRAIAILFLAAAAWPQQKADNKAAPPSDPCPEATTDEVKTRCWEDLAQKADASLNALYQKIQKAVRAKMTEQEAALKDHEQSALEKLQAAQLAWKHYRDAQCAAEEQQYEGGTIAPTVHSGCVKELSDSRREQLQKSYALYLQ